MLLGWRCCRPTSPLTRFFSRVRRRGLQQRAHRTRECTNDLFNPRVTCTLFHPNSRYVHCTPSLEICVESRHHSPGEGTSSEEEDVRTVGDYSFDELLDRIAQAQLKKDERIFESTQGRAEKQSKRARETLMNIHELVGYLRQEAARDICVIKVPPERDYVDYFVVCGGLGTRHIRTMADNLVTEVRGCGDGRGGRVRVEGRDSDEWVAVDLGFAVVHMMLDDARRRYELEKLWTLGPRYDDQLLSMHAHAQHSTDFSLYYAKS